MNKSNICVGVDGQKQFWKGPFSVTPQFLIMDRFGGTVEYRVNAVDDFGIGEEPDYRLAAELLGDCSTIVAHSMSRKCKIKLVEEKGVQVFLDNFITQPEQIARRFILQPCC